MTRIDYFTIDWMLGKRLFRHLNLQAVIRVAVGSTVCIVGK